MLTWVTDASSPAKGRIIPCTPTASIACHLAITAAENAAHMNHTAAVTALWPQPN